MTIPGKPAAHPSSDLWSIICIAVLAAAFVACGRSDEVRATADTAVPAGMPGMEGMPGTGGRHSAGMMDQLQTQMPMMEGAGPDSQRAMLPMHRQLVANMLAQMNREMRDMDMPVDTPWTAVVDSVRQDLRTMPEMSAQDLAELMPAHRARVMRLMDMHRSMMPR
ncbi:MAG TPA: hypothetical protein VMM18_08400 [Gemmatimonadaceae bacterium]|nr:hypothetical protein [Gemmatimonadaceae bacterium]